MFFFTRHGGGVFKFSAGMVFFSPDMVGVFLNFQQAWWWCFLFLIFTWDSGGWQVANKTAALWEAGWDPEKGEFEEAVKLLWRGTQCLERWQ